MVFNGFPVREAGRHDFWIQLQDGDAWRTVATVPVEILIQIGEGRPAGT